MASSDNSEASWYPREEETSLIFISNLQISKLRQEVEWLLKATRQWMQEAELWGPRLGLGTVTNVPLQVAFKSDTLGMKIW